MDKPCSPEPATHFKADSPIESASQDRLRRKEFSRALGKALVRNIGNDPLVVALYGAWGTGKTSVVNMALEEVRLETKDWADKNKPLIVRFNPWHFSDQSQLTMQFLRALTVALERTEPGARAREAGKKLGTYAQLLSPASYIPVVGPWARLAADTLKSTADASTALGDQLSADVEALKSEISAILSSESRKILIIIDDIDRLNSNEIRQIFQLVKCVADFPNTVYVLVFDQTVVVKALEKVQEGNGDDYLEKIVQVPFYLPRPDKDEVLRLAFSLLDEVLKDVREVDWDKKHWANLFHSGIQHMLGTVRDVARFSNALRFAAPLVQHEVNPADLIAITAIQIFAPKMYDAIRANPEMFVGGVSDSDRAVDEEQQRWYEQEFSNNPALSPEQWSEFLKHLFPRLHRIFGLGSYGTSFHSQWRKERRICSPDIFPIYFQLSIAASEISRVEMEAILATATEAGAFAAEVQRLSRDERIDRFLSLLHDFIDGIPPDSAQTIITVLYRIGDSIPDTGMNVFQVPLQMKISYSISSLLERLPDQRSRFGLIECLTGDTASSIRRVVEEVSNYDREHGRYVFAGRESPEPERTFTTEQVTSLEKLALGRIRTAAERQTLALDQHLPTILFRWREWGSTEEVNSFVSQVTQDDSGFIKFLGCFAGESRTWAMGDQLATVTRTIAIESMGKLVDLDAFATRAQAIVAAGPLNKDDAEILSLFLSRLPKKEN